MGFSVANHQTDGNGVQSWDVTSNHNGAGTTVLRVLEPSTPKTTPHHLVYVLPVKPGLSVEFGDGVDVLRLLDAHNTFNCTLIAPSFALEPWIANHPSITNRRYEDFIVLDLHPWIVDNFTLPETEDTWVISFSKGGLASYHLIFRYPEVFNVAASWDAPVIDGVDEAYSGTAYGTEANYLDNYDVVPHLAGYAAADGSFTTRRRLWIGGGAAYRQDQIDFAAACDSEGVLYWQTDYAAQGHSWTHFDGGYESSWAIWAIHYLYIMHLEQHYIVTVAALMSLGFFFV